MNNILYTLYPNDCIGDALPKINANLQSQDILTCNLQTTVDNIDNNLTDFIAVSSYIDEQIYFIRDNFNDFNTAFNAVDKLFPYWSAKQFTVYIPPHQFPPGVVNLSEIIRTSFLNNNLSPSKYEDYTIINVVMTNFNKIKQTGTALNTDVKETSHSIYRYIKIDKGWKHAETISCPNIVEEPPAEVFDEKFNLQIVKIEKVNNKIKIDLICTLIRGEDIENIPDTDFISWDWSMPSIDSAILPVSGYSNVTQEDINIRGAINRAGEVNSVTLEVAPPTFNQTPNTDIIHITSFIYNNKYTQSATVTAALIEVPDSTLFDIDYDIYEYIYHVGDKSINTITRVYDSNRVYNFTIKPKINLKPHIGEYTIKWIITEGNDFKEYIGSDLVFNLTKIGLTKVTCSVTVNSIAWGDTNNLHKEINFYLLDKEIQPVEFITFPKTIWTPNRIDITPEDFYIYDTEPVSIRNRKNNLDYFYVSATADIYDTYIWQVGNTLVRSNSCVSLLEIPYESGLDSVNGITIQLTAYNIYYPESNNTIYSHSAAGMQINPVTATSYVEHKDKHKKNPRLIDYGTYQLQFTTNVYDIDLANNNNKISIIQTISSLNYSTYIIDGVVNYKLSSANWIVDKSVSAVNGVYDLFCLKTGDSTLPLQVDPRGYTDLVLSACAVLNINIDKNDWLPVQQIVCADLLDNRGPVTPAAAISTEEKISTFKHPRPTPSTTTTLTPTPPITPPNTQTPTNTPTNTVTQTNTPTITPTPTLTNTPSGDTKPCPCRGVSSPSIELTGVSRIDGSPAPKVNYLPYNTYEKHKFIIRSFISEEYTSDEIEIIKDALDYWSCVLKDTVLPAQTQSPFVLLGIDNTFIYNNPIASVLNDGYVIFISKHSSAPAGVAGAASYFYTRSEVSSQNQSYYRLPSMGFFWGAASYVNSAKNNITPKGKSGLYYMLLHEIAHTLGFGSAWHVVESDIVRRSFIVGYGDVTDPGWKDPLWTDNYDDINKGESLHANIYYSTNVNNAQLLQLHEPTVTSVANGSGDWVLNMRGCAGRRQAIDLDYPSRSISKAVSAYNECFNFTGTNALTAIPVENHAYNDSGKFSAGSYGSHWSEGTNIIWGDQRLAEGILPAPALQDELMTPQAEENNYDAPVSIITLGAMEDLGWKVNYNLADNFEPLTHRVAYTSDPSKNELMVKKYNTGGYSSPVIIPVPGNPDARIYEHLRAGMTYTIFNDTGEELFFTESDPWGTPVVLTTLTGTLTSSTASMFELVVPASPAWDQTKQPWVKTNTDLRFILMSTSSTTVKNVWMVY